MNSLTKSAEPTWIHLKCFVINCLNQSRFPVTSFLIFIYAFEYWTLQNIPTFQHFIWFYLLSSLFFFFFGVHSTSLKYSTLWKFSLRFVHNSRTNWSFLTKCGSSYPSFNRSMFAHLYTPIHEIWNIKYSNNLFYRLAYLYIYLFIYYFGSGVFSQSVRHT